MIEITSRLPAGYQEVEYIQSSGTQYINTVYALKSQNVRIEIDMEMTAAIVGTVPFGGGATNTFLPSLHRTDTNTKSGFWIAEGAMVCPLDVNTNERMRIDITANNGTATLIVNGGAPTIGTYSGSMSTTHTFHIFAQQNGGQKASMRLRAYKLYDDGTLVRNLVPCYRRSDNAAGMYDLVNGVFYTNAGSGSFAIGEIVNTKRGVISKKWALRRRMMVEGKKYFTVTLTGDFGYTTYDTRSVYINGIDYDAVQTLIVEEGTTIKVTVRTYGSGASSRIYFNGTLMKIASWNETNPNSYSFVLTNNATIKAQKAGHTTGAYYTTCAVYIVM